MMSKSLHFKKHSRNQGKNVIFVLPKQELFLKQNRKSITLFNVNVVEIEQDVEIEPAAAQLIQRALFPQQALFPHLEPFPHHSRLNFHIFPNFKKKSFLFR